MWEGSWRATGKWGVSQLRAALASPRWRQRPEGWEGQPRERLCWRKRWQQLVQRLKWGWGVGSESKGRGAKLWEDWEIGRDKCQTPLSGLGDHQRS